MRKKLLVGVTLVALVTVGIATYSWAAGAASAPTINACANPDGILRMLAPGAACRAAETPVSWNTVGPQGPVGPQGAAGPQGPAGPAGAAAANPDAAAGTVTIDSPKGPIGPITLTAFSHEIVSPRDASSGLPTGKRMHKPFTITKELDKSTPLLLSALVSNENLTSVLIGLLRDGQQVATIKLSNASISDYVTHGMTETWSFTYQKIEWTWTDGGITASDDLTSVG